MLNINKSYIKKKDVKIKIKAILIISRNIRAITVHSSKNLRKKSENNK